VDDWGSIPDASMKLFSAASRQASVPTQHPICWALGAVSTGVKWWELEAYCHLLLVVELYLHFLIYLHGAVLNYISIRETSSNKMNG
jgi:hypothetical protein